MGDRISINFVDGNNYEDRSATLFAHWGGKNLLQLVSAYLYRLYAEEKGDTYPLQRKEPGTVFADFVRDLFSIEQRIQSNYYIVPTPRDGDNSDNGHYYILLYENTFNITKKISKTKGGKL